MHKKVLLSGYFGYENLGDEAILYSIIQELKKMEGVEITALSADPPKTTKKFGVRAAERMKPWSLIKEVSSCDLLISGGGSLLQDVTSKRSILYYIGLLDLAKRIFGKKVMIYSQGIGPVSDPKNRNRVGRSLNRMDIINVRDHQSKQELIEMGVTKEISVTSDTVFLLDMPDKMIGQEYFKALGIDPQKKTIGISIRPWKEYDDKIVTETKKVVEHLQKQDINVLLLPFHHPGDLFLSKRVMDALEETQNVYLIEKQLNEREMLSVIANTDMMLSMRLHGLIFGVVCNSYPIGISYDPKIDSLMKELELPGPVSVKDLQAESLIRQIDEAVTTIDECKQKTSDVALKMKNKAMKNIELIKELLH
ncbi:MAG: polysaccharide pyruvyl transferase CsaB [Peptostreptococcaceae bacterium]|nr:polysaccharide pyruvyl transferase CsaB [Peptostreptococcaceae bacterium]